MLVRRRLEIIQETLADYRMIWRVKRVPSEENKADLLTRIPKSWLLPRATVNALVTPGTTPEARAAERGHDLAHRGVKTTLYFARELMPSVTEADAERAVKTCEWCASVSPHPVDTGNGHLDVPDVWWRIAADVTHMGQGKFLTVIDCGPSRFAVWKKIETEDATTIARGLETAFRTFGPPKEAIFDNGLSFRSSVVRNLCDKWRVHIHFRCADRPSGNSIVERSHRTIKEIAARRGGDVLDAVLVYNMIPRGENWRTPAEMMTGRKWSNPLLETQPDRSNGWRENRREGPFNPGDAVWVRPPRPRCTDQWKEGRVTRIVSPRNIEVDGMPRHPKDLRKRSEGWHHHQERPQAPRRGVGGVIEGRPNDAQDDPQQQSGTAAPEFDDPEVTFGSSTEEEGGPMEVHDPERPTDVQENTTESDQTSDHEETPRERPVIEDNVRRSSRVSRPPERYGEYIGEEELVQLDDDT